MSSVAALSWKEGSDTIMTDSKWEDSKYNTDYAKSKYYSELEAWRRTLFLLLGEMVSFG